MACNCIVFYFCLRCFFNKRRICFSLFNSYNKKRLVFGNYIYVLNNRFERKKLILYEDEIKILEQLRSGKMYQKEVEGFSENTVYRKLKAARERNGNITKDELLELYKKEHPLDS